jgi:hypothetical protein
MFKYIVLCGALVLVSSCTGQESASAVASAGSGEPAAVAAPPAPPEPLPLADAASIAGKWDVVSFEGYRPRRLSGTHRAAYADFSERGVGLRMECNYSGRAGTIRDGKFIASEADDGAQTVMSCGRERDARESRFFSFFDKDATIERIGPDRLLLRSGATELILERPAVRRLQYVPTPAELEGRWRLLEVTHYMPGGGYSGIGLSEVPGRIVVSGDRLSYSRCPQFGLTFRVGPDGRLEKTGGTAPPATPADCRELAEPAPGRELPSQWDVLRLLHDTPLVEKTGEDALLISTERFGLLVTKAPCQTQEQSNDHRTTRVVDCASSE